MDGRTPTDNGAIDATNIPLRDNIAASPGDDLRINGMGAADNVQSSGSTMVHQKLYDDPKRWSFLFQTYIQRTMIEEHCKPCKVPVKIMERSLLRQD